jgi:hypothetical protein
MHLEIGSSLEPRAWLIRPVFAEDHANFLWLMTGYSGYAGSNLSGRSRSRQQKQN